MFLYLIQQKLQIDVAVEDIFKILRARVVMYKPICMHVLLRRRYKLLPLQKQIHFFWI
jgi:hypothetical protein